MKLYCGGKNSACVHINVTPLQTSNTERNTCVCRRACKVIGYSQSSTREVSIYCFSFRDSEITDVAESSQSSISTVFMVKYICIDVRKSVLQKFSQQRCVSCKDISGRLIKYVSFHLVGVEATSCSVQVWRKEMYCCETRSTVLYDCMRFQFECKTYQTKDRFNDCCWQCLHKRDNLLNFLLAEMMESLYNDQWKREK